MVLGLRLTGWTIMLAGVGIYFLLGDMTIKTTWGQVGIIVAIGGMICTSLSGVVGTLAYRKRLRKSIEEAEASRAAPSDKPE